MELQNLLTWRYATKAMNGQKVDDAKITRILEAIRLAPTANGLQPYELIVVSNPEWKAKLKPVCANQSVVTDGSHLIIFAAWDNITADRINLAFDNIILERGVYGGLEDYRNFLLKSHAAQPVADNFNHAARQAYIGLGFGLIASANEAVDATPMEGFDPDAVDELLSLPEQGLKSIAMMAVGYRNVEKDWLVNMKKVRKPAAAFITELR